ncbi:MAG TPA: hypothetical protein VGL04_07810, partial [Sporichthyaceae bacterium]
MTITPDIRPAVPANRRGDADEATPTATPSSAAQTGADVSTPTEDFVQLLTPEGELVDHPEYACDFTDAELRGLYRDLVLVRRIDAEATALQRQGELGIWA